MKFTKIIFISLLINSQGLSSGVSEDRDRSYTVIQKAKFIGEDYEFQNGNWEKALVFEFGFEEVGRCWWNREVVKIKKSGDYSDYTVKDGYCEFATPNKCKFKTKMVVSDSDDALIKHWKWSRSAKPGEKFNSVTKTGSSNILKTDYNEIDSMTREMTCSSS